VAEPLKAMYTESFLRGFAERVKMAYPAFGVEAFVPRVTGKGWDALELKGRIRRITESLGALLPSDYGEAIAILMGISGECRGFPYLFFPDFVERFGLDDWERSLAALEAFTKLSTAEFAVRPFLKRDPERMMEQMKRWSGHADEHVRRLASEGCRPRLPWADALPAFKADPSPILPILERLKDDPSEYVRRSVANNLNDISKDHPGLVLELARNWKGGGDRVDGVVRRACRGLIRAGAPEALALFGLAPLTGIEAASMTAEPPQIAVGESVEAGYTLRVPVGEPVKLRLELAVTFPRTGGKRFRKLFKLSEKTVPGGTELRGSRRHAFADLSTRRHYPGEHTLALVVNGEEVASVTVLLLEPAAAEGGGAKR